MLKTKDFPHQIIFDIETVPCLETAKRVYPELQEIQDAYNEQLDGDEDHGITQAHTDLVLLDKLYEIAGATEENPKPFLKYFLHRVVSISGISRKMISPTEDNPAGIELILFSIPNGDLNITEADIIQKFLFAIGERKPQLVGWCSTMFDIPALVQRALINNVSVPRFCARPDKPWEGVDYFSNGSDYNVDLLKLIDSSSPQSKATLNEFARALRIPGKLFVSGADVAGMWFNGQHREIVNYNECDTCTTYLIWLNMLYMTGHIIDKDNYELELDLFRRVLEEKIASGSEHLQRFLTEWDELQGVVIEDDSIAESEAVVPTADDNQGVSGPADVLGQQIDAFAGSEKEQAF